MSEQIDDHDHYSHHDHDHDGWQEWQTRKIIRLLREQLVVLLDIRDILQPKQLTRTVAVQFDNGDWLMQTNNLIFNVGDTSTANVIGFLADGVTPSGGVPSNVVFTFNDPSATVVLNSDGLTALCTGVAASSGAINGSVSFTITDTDGVVSQWNAPFTITTNAVIQQQQLTQSVAVQFSDPVAGGGGVATPKLGLSKQTGKAPLNQ